MEVMLAELCRKGTIESIQDKNLTFFYNMSHLSKERNYWVYPVFDIFVVSEFGDVIPALITLARNAKDSYYGKATRFFNYLRSNNIIDKETEIRLNKLNELMREKRIPIERFAKKWSTYGISYHVEIANTTFVNEAVKIFA